MQQATGITVEEVGLEEWLHTAFLAERAPQPRRSRKPPSCTLAKVAVSRLFGARPLYWSWLAGAALSLLLQAT
ncbi:MAG: hypothetical protein ACK5RK_08020 [Betaproteobacteria bacterium]